MLRYVESAQLITDVRVSLVVILGYLAGIGLIHMTYPNLTT